MNRVIELVFNNIFYLSSSGFFIADTIDEYEINLSRLE